MSDFPQTTTVIHLVIELVINPAYDRTGFLKLASKKQT